MVHGDLPRSSGWTWQNSSTFQMFNVMKLCEQKLELGWTWNLLFLFDSINCTLYFCKSRQRPKHFSLPRNFHPLAPGRCRIFSAAAESLRSQTISATIHKTIQTLSTIHKNDKNKLLVIALDWQTWRLWPLPLCPKKGIFLELEKPWRAHRNLRSLCEGPTEKLHPPFINGQSAVAGRCSVQSHIFSEDAFKNANSHGGESDQEWPPGGLLLLLQDTPA